MNRNSFIKNALLLATGIVTSTTLCACDDSAKNIPAKSGPRQAINCKIVVSKNLQELGVKHGEVFTEKLPKSKETHLSIYLIFNKKFEGTIQVRILNSKELETGRSLLEDHSADAGEAGWHEFDFPEKTQINERSSIHLDLIRH